MIAKYFKIFFFIGISVLFSCNGVKKTKAEKERADWIAGFTDSVSYYQHETERVQKELDDLNDEISKKLAEFDYIKNPKEVSGYYILKGWEEKIPLTKTGIYARISETEKFELIATLSGATFDKIAVGEGDNKIYSEIVPNDQAFNYRHKRFTTVYFQGDKADSIGWYISLHPDYKITLEFLESKLKSKFVMPENEKEMISKTWQLYSTQKELQALQKELWINSKKIETFRRIMHTEAQTSDKQ